MSSGCRCGQVAGLPTPWPARLLSGRHLRNADLLHENRLSAFSQYSAKFPSFIRTMSVAVIAAVRPTASGDEPGKPWIDPRARAWSLTAVRAGGTGTNESHGVFGGGLEVP